MKLSDLKPVPYNNRQKRRTGRLLRHDDWDWRGPTGLNGMVGHTTEQKNLIYQLNFGDIKKSK